MSIKLTDVDALERLNAKLNALTNLQETMKAINVIIRKKNLSDDEKITKICVNHKISREEAEKILHPKGSWQSPGFGTWQLSNNNSEINRIKKRIIEVKNYQNSVKEVKNSGEMPEFIFDGGKIVDNIPENRLQIFFDDKPDAGIRTKLKQNGFRWAPSHGAWQSYRHNYTLDWTKKEFKVEATNGD